MSGDTTIVSPFAHQCRQLKAKRLPSASRHQDKQILSGECVLDNFPLQRPELVVAETFFECAEQFHGLMLPK